jgi:uncharacterized OB-fold protein
MTTGQPFRILPRLDDWNREYWSAGEHGELRLLRCTECRNWHHPGGPVCPICHSRSLAWEATGGRGLLHTFTVNHQPWYPGLEPPYAIGVVELPEQTGLRITAGIVGIDPAEIRIDTPMVAVFEQYDDVWLPFWSPEVAS